ncbi:MAG: hypothetical protein ACOCP4_01375 [Candidatus Woesearchaeota archaeon]
MIKKKQDIKNQKILRFSLNKIKQIIKLIKQKTKESKIKTNYIISIIIILLSINTLNYDINYDKTDTPRISEYLKLNSKNHTVYANYQFYSEFFMYTFSENKTEYFNFRDNCFQSDYYQKIIICKKEDYNLIHTNRYTINDLKKFLNFIKRQENIIENNNNNIRRSNQFYYVDGNYLPREKHDFELEFLNEYCKKIRLNYIHNDIQLYECSFI